MMLVIINTVYPLSKCLGVMVPAAQNRIGGNLTSSCRYRCIRIDWSQFTYNSRIDRLPYRY